MTVTEKDKRLFSHFQCNSFVYLTELCITPTSVGQKLRVKRQQVTAKAGYKGKWGGNKRVKQMIFESLFSDLPKRYIDRFVVV